MQKLKEMYDSLHDMNKGVVIGFAAAVILYIAVNIIAYFV